MNEMRLSAYFANYHRLCVFVLLLLCGISLDLCKSALNGIKLHKNEILLKGVRFWFALLSSQIICCAGLNNENNHCIKEYRTVIIVLIYDTSATLFIRFKFACYSGVYWICASPNCTDVRGVFCDMRNGGWTLIGQLGGVTYSIYDKWLVTNVNTRLLRRPTIEHGTHGCIDAVDLAVNYAHEVSRFRYAIKTTTNRRQTQIHKVCM